ncbi:MAG: hypothetical protein C0599_05745 [Salinivirgaceae bacterium]|nr:MAG: hypothetical protein C0599_05745 [Salinivirgaceae bacterium]
MINLLMRKLLLFFVLVFFVSLSIAQTNADSTKLKSDLGFDFVSRYLWRGMMVNTSPNLQPYLGFEYKGISIGAWGSYATDGQFAEVDLYLSYAYDQFTFTINDYYTEDENDFGRFDNFNYKNNVTNHALELMVDYDFGEKLPLTLTAATIFYGNDKKTNGDNYFSTWLQANYTLKLNEYNLDVFLGGTPAKSIYNTQEGNMAEIGVKLSRIIDLSDKFSMPMSVALVTNPADENIFMVLSLGVK